MFVKEGLCSSVPQRRDMQAVHSYQLMAVIYGSMAACKRTSGMSKAGAESTVHYAY